MSIGIRSEKSVRDGSHPMGIDILDQEIIRGIPKGSTVVILGDPSSSGEMLLHALASTERKTKYISSLRRDDDGLIEDITRMGNMEKDNIRQSTDIMIEPLYKYETHDKLHEELLEITNDVKQGNLIIDSFSSYLNEFGKEMINSASEIHKQVKDSNGLCYLYIPRSDGKKVSREGKEILQMVDGVFNIQTEYIGSDRVENKLMIPKMRGLDLPDNPIKINFERNIQIDTTSDIG